MTHECTEQLFLKDVANHQMTVLRDDGVCRHIRFKKPDSSDMYFDLLTWPGWLCYSGDMGTYVFRRLHDMFEFFGDDRRHKGEPGLYINLPYWAEKVEAEERHGGVKKYSPDKFRQQIQHWLDGRNDCSAELREAVENEVLIYADDGEYAAMKSALDFRHENESVFQDFWEADLREYTFRFVWCCYAITWGIQKYDAKHTKNTETAL